MTASVHRHPSPVDHVGADHNHGNCSEHSHWAGGSHDEPVEGSIDLVESTPLTDPAGHAIRGRHYRATVEVESVGGVHVLRVYIDGPGLNPGWLAWCEASVLSAEYLLELGRDNARRMVSGLDHAETRKRAA